MSDVFKEFQEANPDYEVIYVAKTGSTLYGTNGPNSDVDYKGIFIPPKRDVLLKQDLEHWTTTTGDDKSKNGADDVDIQLWSIYKFMQLLAKGETGAMDLLFSMGRQDIIVHQTLRSEEIWRNRDKFIHKKLHAFIGYCVGQSKKYNIKGERYAELKDFLGKLASCSTDTAYSDILTTHNYKYIKLVMAPNARGNKGVEDVEYLSVLGKLFLTTLDRKYITEKLSYMEKQYGNRSKASVDTIDYKALSHAVRVILEVAELLETGHITFPLEDAEYIKHIKFGNENIEDTMNYISHMIDRVDRLMVTSNLPECINTRAVENVLLGYTI